MTGPSRRTVLKAAGWGTALASAGINAGTAPSAIAAPGVGVGPTSVEHTTTALGIDIPRPRLSWQLTSTGTNLTQAAYRVRVATSTELLNAGQADVWDSGRVESDQSLLVDYAGPPLAARTRYFWTVQVWASDGTASPWSEPSWWETGLLDPSNWTASWISGAGADTSQLRSGFSLEKPVARARLYATALGVYEAKINGSRVGDHQLAPGWTDYHRRVQYQTYDVTDLLRQGDNAVGVRVGPGWYAGHVGMWGPHQYGDRPWLLAQLEVVYDDGTTAQVVSDAGWRSVVGPIRSSDLLMGEHYDAREETPGWSAPGFDDAGWQPALVSTDVRVEPVAQADPPVRVTEHLPALSVSEPRPGVHVYDLGQNMVGSVRLKVSGQAGQEVRLRHAEVLNPDGTIYTDNLREAKATDVYVCSGGGEQVYEPRFTFHGFRYVEVTGYPGPPQLEAVVGRVMHTDAPLTMDFSTDQPMLDQLHRNITWGQRGNFLSVPTDTPARDERLGWTGDINVFVGAAAYTMRSAGFLAKWMADLRDCQTTEGSFPDIAPLVGDIGNGTAGWGDAGVTVPWVLYERYGDLRVLEENYPAMRRWISYLESTSEGYLRPESGAVYGDWLNVDQETRKDLIATAWFGYAARQVRQVAEVLGQHADARRYQQVYDRVRSAFGDAFVTPAGLLRDDPELGAGDTQTGYVLALSIGLLPEQLRVPAADRLVKLIEERDWHLSTGFLGTPQLLPTLTETGHLDVAYRLLSQRTFPSWGYQIDRGATTMWERWDSIKVDGSFNDPSMNSFNHYAYGSVGEWMYQNIAGIRPGAPGFKEIVIRPMPGGGIRRARGSYASDYGTISSRWEYRQNGFVLEVSVPVNTSAEVWVPGRRVAADPGARFLRSEDGCEVFAVGSGTWSFTAA